MALIDHPDLRRMLLRIGNSMLSRMDIEHATYTEEHVDRCREILISHAEDIDEAQDEDSSAKLVRTTVLKLNQLNYDTGHDLIDEELREFICGFLSKAGSLKGRNAPNVDVTEVWREW
ncbi:MAG: hypothetical protein WKF77_24400 [Planctomycetaceae bacterium]